MGVSASKPLDIKTKWFPSFEQSLPSLEGKTVVITGCTSGTGYITARTAIRKDAKHILLLNRSSDRATKAEESLKHEKSSASDNDQTIETIACDLQDFDSVRNAIEKIKSKYDSIDVLCNNAGVMALEDKATTNGYDIQMQTNHLSHFLLSKELLPLLQKAADMRGEARIVNHSSEARHGGDLLQEYFQKKGGNLGGNGNSMFFKGARWVRYQQSKLANSVFSYTLAKKLGDEESKLKSVCAHPGLSATNLQTTTAAQGGMGSGMWFMRMAQSQEDGSMPIIAGCFDSSTKNGSFWAPKRGFSGPAVQIEFDKASKKEESMNMLWVTSEESCSISFDI